MRWSKYTTRKYKTNQNKLVKPVWFVVLVQVHLGCGNPGNRGCNKPKINIRTQKKINWNHWIFFGGIRWPISLNGSCLRTSGRFHKVGRTAQSVMPNFWEAFYRRNSSPNFMKSTPVCFTTHSKHQVNTERIYFTSFSSISYWNNSDY